MDGTSAELKAKYAVKYNENKTSTNARFNVESLNDASGNIMGKAPEICVYRCLAVKRVARSIASVCPVGDRGGLAVSNQKCTEWDVRVSRLVRHDWCVMHVRVSRRVGAS